MEKLINELIKAGCSRERWRSRCSAAATSPTRRNADRHRELPSSSCAISRPKGCAAPRRISAGSYPRRIQYYPATGRVVRRLLGISETHAVAPRRNRITPAACRRSKTVRRHRTVRVRGDDHERMPVRVLVVDDSAVMRQLLTDAAVGRSRDRGRRHRARSACRARADQGAQSRRRHARHRDAAHGRRRPSCARSWRCGRCRW